MFTPTQLAEMHDRFVYPRFSRGEYERRYRNIREMMRQHGFDCLLIAGGSASYGRLWANIRYITNMMGKADQCTYAVFPKEGDPWLIIGGHADLEAMAARSITCNLVPPKPTKLAAVVRVIGELGCGAGRIGIVEFDAATSIPRNHWDFLVSQLPRAEIAAATEAFLALRLVKSEEEIACMERSSELNDVGIRALADGLRPGMTEADAFASVYAAVLRAGGEIGMIQLASAAMDDPDVNDQRPRPVDRVIGSHDFINNELGVFYNGYEAQSGKPIVIGTPTDVIEEMFTVALAAYRAIAATLIPGGTSAQTIRAAQCIRDGGYDTLGSFLQGMFGYDPRYEPQIGFPAPTGAPADIVYQEGMAFVVQPHLVTPDHRLSLFLGDTFAITRSGPRCLNKLAPQLICV